MSELHIFLIFQHRWLWGVIKIITMQMHSLTTYVNTGLIYHYVNTFPLATHYLLPLSYNINVLSSSLSSSTLPYIFQQKMRERENVRKRRNVRFYNIYSSPLGHCQRDWIHQSKWAICNNISPLFNEWYSLITILYEFNIKLRSDKLTHYASSKYRKGYLGLEFYGTYLFALLRRLIIIKYCAGSLANAH